MSRQIVVTCEHGEARKHSMSWRRAIGALGDGWVDPGEACDAAVPLDLGSLPPAAIEAAARAQYDADGAYDLEWEHIDDAVKGWYREQATFGLRAALSVLVAEPQETP